MTAARYTQLRGLAQVAEIRTARYEGVEHLVVPVVAMVGDSVLRPLGSEGPEYVPADVLAVAPEAWNDRVVLEDHPLDGGAPISANRPEILESQGFGRVFNARYEDRRLKVEAWINPERVERAGAKAQKVLARLRALAEGETEELVEVSVGAYVLLEKRSGTAPDGKHYDYIWLSAVPDHLAVGLGGSKGACSAEAGCGAPRSAQESEPALSPLCRVQKIGDKEVGQHLALPGRDLCARHGGMSRPPRAALRAAALAQARRPTFSGTETGPWSTPSFADYVRYLHEGAEGPSSVSQASAALKRSIAAHSLLGDPEGSNLRELAFFPVVNPATGHLNERALRAVVSGRGAQADIPERARNSAQDMARRLLNSEFGAELEVSKMSADEDKAGAARQKAAAESENLQQWLRDALEEIESGYDYLWVESFDVEAGTVVYMVRGEDGEINGTYRRSYQLDGETVTVGEERTEVRRRVVYEDAPAPAEVSAARLQLPPMLVKALAAIGFRPAQGEDGHSDVEVRDAIWKALNSAVPAFYGVAEIYHETRTAIYATHPDEGAMTWWRRTYEIDEDGVVTLNDDAEEVEIEQSWKPVQARLQFDAAEGEERPCGCNEENGEGQAAPSQDDQGGRMTNEMKQLVGRLIASKHCRYGEDDRATLEAMSQDRLKALSEALPDDNPEGEQEPAAGEEGKEPQKAAAPAEPEKATEPKAAAEEKPAAAPAKDPDPAEESVKVSKGVYEDMKAASAAWKAEQARKHAALVKSLAGAQDGFSEGDLKAMPLEQLGRLARALRVDEPEPAADYSGRAMAEPTEARSSAPPDPYAAALRAHRRQLGLPDADPKEAN